MSRRRSSASPAVIRSRSPSRRSTRSATRASGAWSRSSDRSRSCVVLFLTPLMSKHVSPLLGYNNNVRHKNRVFHIQTEDSGVKYGHIITHLFMDGGRILKSVKTSYAEYVDNDRMGEIVREMMKQQHKAMFIALRDGKFDPIIDGAADASQATRAVAAESPPRPAPP